MGIPKIGITANIKKESTPNWEGYRGCYVGDFCVQSVLSAGGIPMVLPVINSEEVIKEQVASVDGVLLSGGQDIHPSYWGEEPIPELGVISAERDFFDLKIIKYALELGKPIFGICRGCQILNVFCGGTLYQDLKVQANISVKHIQDGDYTEPIHSVLVNKDSRFAKVLGEKAMVNSYHHMAVKDVAERFICTAKSTDGIVEMYESPKDDLFIVGVQWHPEMMAGKHHNMLEMFKIFINTCKNSEH